jgi:hypothetical protein
MSLQKLKSILLRQRTNKLLDNPEKAFVPSDKDVYLVSYPRSGNTWMRVILSELLYGYSPESIKDLQNFVPDIHVDSPLLSAMPVAEFHAVKSHFQYCISTSALKDSRSTLAPMHYQRVIYIVRDPRDVAISYYKYLKKLQDYNASFDDFLQDWLTGRIWPCSWQEHVNSWLGSRNINSTYSTYKLHLVRYEDMVANPLHQLSQIAQFLNLSLNNDELERIVSSASVEQMRSREQSGMPAYEKAEGYKFISSAAIGQWKNELSESNLALVNKYASQAMELLSYTRASYS